MNESFGPWDGSRVLRGTGFIGFSNNWAIEVWAGTDHIMPGSLFYQHHAHWSIAHRNVRETHDVLGFSVLAGQDRAMLPDDQFAGHVAITQHEGFPETSLHVHWLTPLHLLF